MKPQLEPVWVWLTRCAAWSGLFLAIIAFWIWVAFATISGALEKATFDASWACQVGADCEEK